MAELMLSWFARFPIVRPEGLNTPPIGKVHFCESEIADRKIAYCGEELVAEDGASILTKVDEPTEDQKCKTCAGRPTPVAK